MWRITLIAALAMMATACLGSDFADSLEGSWLLKSGVVDGEEIPILDSHPVTITFEGDQVSGTASCNGFGGTYVLDGATISIGDLAMTEMGCFPEEAMQAEAMFAEGITRVDTVTLDGGLALSGDGVEMMFEALEPVPEAELTNTVWVLDGLMQGDRFPRRSWTHGRPSSSSATAPSWATPAVGRSPVTTRSPAPR